MNTPAKAWKFFLVFVSGLVILLGSCDLFSAGDGGSGESLTYLGKGYDIFDPYADSTQVADYILDIDALRNDGMVEFSNEENSTTYSMSGETVSEYLSSYNVSAGVSGDYKLFSGTLSAKFGSASYSSLTSAYATYSSTVRKYKEKIYDQYNHADILRSYVRANVRDALDNCETEEDALDFFDSYGTHVILWDYLGARVDYHATTESSDSNFVGNFETKVEAAFTGLSTDEEYSEGTEYDEFSSETSRQLRVYGGPSQYANSILTGDYSAWEEGVGDSATWTLCDFDRDDGLMPVWELCSGDDDGVDEVSIFQDAFATWAADNELDVPTEIVEPSSYSVVFSLDYVKCYIDDEEDDHQAEFQGELTIDGSDLWSVSGDGHSIWGCSEDDWVTTSTIDYVDSSSRYSSVSRTFSDSDMEDTITLRVNWLTEDDALNDDEFSTEQETYSVESVVSWDGLHWVIVSEDGGNEVKFYVLIDVTENYD